MSSVGQAVGGVVGVVVGAIYGGPVGALYGFQIGAGVGGYVDPAQTTVQGQKIGELAVQTSREGVPRPVVFGASRPIGGNIIATTEPNIVVKREESGGKGGGGSTTVENEEVYRTYAIRVCEGPITGYKRIWRNGKLVYDAKATSQTGIDNNNQFLSLATLYLGAYDQMPDSTLQAVFGVDNVVAHRGTAYMVIDNENLTQLGGAIPQYMFEVERCEGFFITSQPYAVEFRDAIDVAATINNAGLLSPPREPMDISGSINSIDLVVAVLYSQYDMQPEPMDISGSVNSIDLVVTVIYSQYDMQPEPMDISGSVNSIDLVVTVGYINYDMQPEPMDISASINTISLVTV